MTDTVETLLEAMFEGRWPADVNLYRLNTLLQLKPWWPPLREVWLRRAIGPDPEMVGTAYYAAWPEALALVTDLHAKYQAARQ